MPEPPPTAWKKHKAVDYNRIIGWKSTKLPISGHHRTASEAPFTGRFAGGPFWLLSIGFLRNTDTDPSSPF